jgi:hypothetical protein
MLVSKGEVMIGESKMDFFWNEKPGRYQNEEEYPGKNGT